MSSSEPSAVIRQPVFMNSFLANILPEKSFLAASPVHYVMRILLCSTLKVSCHVMFKFSSSSSHFSIASPIFAFICFPNPASIGWTLSVGFSGSRYKWWHWSRFCAFHESSSLFVSKYYYQDQTLVKTRRGAKNPKLLVTCYITVFLWSTSKRRGTWPILYLFFGVHRPYFTSWVELSQYGQYAPPLNARHLHCDFEGKFVFQTYFNWREEIGICLKWI